MPARSKSSSIAAQGRRRSSAERETRKSTPSVAVHHFVLWIEGGTELTQELEDRLFEAGCDDALLAASHGRVFLEFDREDGSLAAAVASAIRDVRSAGYSIDKIGLDDLVNSAEIARRVGRSRASVSQLIRGDRGPGAFPPSFQSAGHSPLWQWQDVHAWFSRAGLPGSTGEKSELYEIDLAFQLVRRIPDKSRRDRLIELLESA